MTPVAQKYTRLQIALHWATLLLLIASYVSSDYIKPAWRALTRGADVVTGTGGQVHVWVGVTVLVLTLIRLLIRLIHGAPPEVAGQPRILSITSRATHVALYALLIAVPGVGALAWFGAVTDAGEVHEVLFNLAMAVVLLHVAAALYHQFIVKDGLLRRMM